jgi:hypothetical protein
MAQMDVNSEMIVRANAGIKKAAELQRSSKQRQTSPFNPRIWYELQSSLPSVTPRAEAKKHPFCVNSVGSGIHSIALQYIQLDKTFCK